jgi:hypothetical protein
MEPVINFEEKIGKTVGKRKAPKDAFAYAMGLQRTGVALSRSFKHGGLCPRGVYRFKTHEEANAWMLKMLSRPRRTES